MTLRLSDEEGDNRALDIKAVAAIFDDCVSDGDLNKNRAFSSGVGPGRPGRRLTVNQLPHGFRREFRDGSILVVRFTNNVMVILASGVRQRKLLRSAATHALANSAGLVE